MIIALVMAVALTGTVTPKLKALYRSVIYLPNVVSAVAMGTMWINYVYNSDYGLLHSVFFLQASALKNFPQRCGRDRERAFGVCWQRTASA